VNAEIAHSWVIRDATIAACFFVLGVLTQNVPLLPMSSEYQPVLYCGILPFALWRAHQLNTRISRLRLLEMVMFGACMMLLLAGALFVSGSPPFTDIARMLALPMVACSTWIYLRDVPQRVVRVVILIHVAILLLGLVAPEVARSLAGIGGRGQAYYEGWNSYFYAEPSYAALTFLFLAFFSCRAGRMSSLDTALLALLSMSTLSVTGVIVAAVIAGTFLWQRSRTVFFVIVLGVPTVVASIALVPTEGSVLAIGRLAALSAAIRDLGGLTFQGVLMALNAVEPSGMWRILTNLYAVSCVDGHPLGFGSTDMAAAIWRSDCSASVGAVISQSLLYLQLNPGSTASSVFANLVLFAGIPGAALGAVLVVVQLSAFRHPTVRSMLPLAAMLILFFLVWQSAWAAPTASVLIAAAYLRPPGPAWALQRPAAPSRGPNE
jgi:hypothetical protein